MLQHKKNVSTGFPGLVASKGASTSVAVHWQGTIISVLRSARREKNDNQPANRLNFFSLPICHFGRHCDCSCALYHFSELEIKLRLTVA